jgi:hypothetical protein
MPNVPRGFVHQGQLDAELENAVRKLGPEVVHVAHRIAPDWTEQPSIFFRIVLADASTREEILVDTTEHIATTLLEEVRPIENWGLHPYFNFRSESEQQSRPDPDWM